MTKVSVIIPIYNAKEYLERTIKSVLSQSYENFELILVDDGSIDSSLEICENFAKSDDRVLVLTQSNKGVSSARNKGLKRATGQWVYFLDSDDTLDNNALKECSNCFNLGVDVIQFASRRIQYQEVISYRQTLEHGRTRVTDGFNEFIDNSQIGALCVWLHLISRDLIVDNNISFSEDMNYNEDMLFMYTVMMHSNKQVFIGHILHNQYLVDNSLSRSPITKVKIENRLLLVKRVFELSKLNPLYEDKLNSEGNKLLEWYFVSLFKFVNKSNVMEFNNDYKNFFNSYKPFINTFFAKIARFDIRIILIALDLKFSFRNLINR
ncbi:glycosyltransferase family 2 protein [Vibrio breoganii]